MGSTRSRTKRFEMSKDGDEEDQEEAEGAEDDDRRMPELVWCSPQQRSR